MSSRPLAFPFKRPFKGKRSALREHEALELELPHIERQLVRLTEDWSLRTAIDGLGLAIVRQGAPILRWRVSKKFFGEQRYIDLFGDAGAPIIESASSDVLQLLIGYESRRALLNARSRASHAAYRALTDYRSAIDRLPPCPDPSSATTAI